MTSFWYVSNAESVHVASAGNSLSVDGNARQYFVALITFAGLH